MSTGADCSFREVEPGRWKYRLQRYPYGETEDYDEYGPFDSFGRAHKHLDDNHANPGGASIDWLTDGRHVHLFVEDEAHVPTGVEVTVRIDSLGPDATLEQAVAVVQALPPDHAAFRVHQTYGFRKGVFCESCHEPRP
jgi:hypothetical protein